MTLPTNKNLEDLFNLPEADTFFDDDMPTVELDKEEITQDALTNMERINQALPAVKGLDASDTELNVLSDLAKHSFKDLLELGMQVDSKSAGEILSVSQQFLGHAITAQQAKINKKLKMIDLQLKKAKLDMDKGDAPEELGTASGQVLDRNALLEKVLNEARSLAEANNSESK